jgi:magnesium transporter
MDRKDAIQQVLDLLLEDRYEDALGHFEDLWAPDQTEIFDALPRGEQIQLLPHLPRETAADIFQEMNSRRAARLSKELDLDMLAEIVDHMAPDEAADLLGDMEEPLRQKVLENMQHPGPVEPLLSHKDDTAGGRMTSEFVSVSPDTTIEEVLDLYRDWKPREENVHYTFVVEDGKLVGVLGPFDLIRGESDKKVSDLMDKKVHTVHVDEDQEQAARLMARYELGALPVLNDEDNLVGVITFGDAIRTLDEEATEDILKSAGLSGVRKGDDGESERSRVMVEGSMWEVWKVRVPFLLVAMVGGLLAGTVIDVFEGALQAVTALAIFIPVVMDMGGNAGTQSATIFARGLAMGQITEGKFVRPLLRELGIGLGMGLILGAAVGLIAAVWQGMFALGLVVGLALGLTIVISALLGFVVPFLMVKVGMDQAAGSTPFITTIKDITGLLIYFSLAYALLGISA